MSADRGVDANHGSFQTGRGFTGAAESESRGLAENRGQGSRERQASRVHPINTDMARLSKPSVAGTVNDAELVARIGRRDQAAFEILMRRYNGKLFRVARAIVKDDAEAEDALQDTYLEAYRRIGSFRGESQLVT